MRSFRLVPILALLVSLAMSQFIIHRQQGLIARQNEALRKASSAMDDQSAAIKAQQQALSKASSAMKACGSALDTITKPEKPPQPSADLTCQIIHQPKQGCPSGYVREDSPRFTEKDGSKEFACLSSDPTKESCTDVLRPGEGEVIMFEIPAPAPEPQPANTGKS
jgi:hypothetical protein